MRVMLLCTTLIVAMGCGEKKVPVTSQGGQSAAPAPPSPPTGPVVDVRMTGDGTSKAAFAPSALTIAPGTVVRFINVSGGPHNVAFWPDSVPPGGRDALKSGMPDQMTALTGPFLTQANEHYDVSFGGASPGMYVGYCQPHLVLGMRIVITVK